MNTRHGSSANLEDLVRHSHAICIVFTEGADWPVEYVSDNVRQLGYEPEEFLQRRRSYTSIIHPQDLQRVLDESAQFAAERRDKFTQEYRIITGSGAVVWVEDRTRVLHDASGADVKWQGTIVDVTGRKLAELELAAARDGLLRNLRFTESLLAAIPTPVFFKDAAGRYLGCNQAFTEFMGVTPEDIRGKTVGECWPSEFAEVYDQRDAELMRDPHLQVYDFKVRDRDGVDRAVIYAKNVFRDENDEVAGIVGAFIDISDRQRAESELRHRLELEKVLTEISAQFVGRQSDDMDASIDEALRALGPITGADRIYVAELREGATGIDRFHEWCPEGISPHVRSLQGLSLDDFPAIGRHILRDMVFHVPRVASLTEGSPERVEFDYQGIRSVLLVPMVCAGSVSGFVGFDAVEAEKSWSEDDVALLQVAAQIFANGLGRRRAETQLRQAQKLESIGRLAAGVAHGLNNMLTPILGFAHLLRAELEDRPEALEDVTEIIHATERSRDLVAQLLAFARTQILDLKPTELPAIIRGMEKLLRSAIREHIQVEIVTPPSACTVCGDAGQLEQVVMNLSLNAQDAMPRGGTLLVETGEVDLDDAACAGEKDLRPGRYATLTVSDTGLGMDDATREHVFEPFFTTKERGAGAGLGLATVYGIVKQHGGSIRLESEPGKGSTFTIYLPAAGDTASPVEEEAEPSTLPGIPSSTTVVVVEDDDAARRLVTSALSRAGCRVLSAASGRECLELLERHPQPIDLLVADVIMGDLDGRELHEQLARRVGPPGGLKVLFMSGYPRNVVAHHGVLDEGMDFIRKPFSVEQLLEKVRLVLNRPA